MVDSVETWTLPEIKELFAGHERWHELERRIRAGRVRIVERRTYE